MATSSQVKPPHPSGIPPAAKAKSSTSPVANKQGKVVPVEVPKLTDLPGYMDTRGWPISALLMRKWFAGPARAMTLDEKKGKIPPEQYPAALVDTTSVTLEWVLGFARVKKLYDNFFSYNFSGAYKFDSPKARLELLKSIKRANLFTNQNETFGDLSKPPIWQHKRWQFNYFKVDVDPDDRFFVYMGELDDLFGALAGFGVYVAAAGTVTPITKEVGAGKERKVLLTGYEVTIPQVLVYARDTYDFIGDQYLGHWSKTGPKVEADYFTADKFERLKPSDYQLYYEDGEIKFPVGNWNFNDYRARHKKGGDLLIFTNGRKLRLNRPIRIFITAEQAAALK